MIADEKSPARISHRIFATKSLRNEDYNERLYCKSDCGRRTNFVLLLQRQKSMVEEARTRHNMSPIATTALGRLMTGGAMMGTMMKSDADVLTIQIKGNGPIGQMTVTADAKGRVKGFVANPEVMLPLKDGKLDVAGAVGIGVLSVIKDIGLKEPYVGDTILITSEIADDLTYYFATSEQVPSSVGLGVADE